MSFQFQALTYSLHKYLGVHKLHRQALQNEYYKHYEVSWFWTVLQKLAFFFHFASEGWGDKHT